MRLPILIAIPHGKTTLPGAVRDQILLSDDQILENYCDYGSDELFMHDYFSLLIAHYSRLFCDLNRPHDDWTHSPDGKRAGVVRQITESGEDIYPEQLSKKEKEERTKGHKDFYAKCLQIAKKEKIQFFISAHTMEDHPPHTEPTLENKRADIVISANKYETCDKPTADLLSESFRAQGFTVKIDDPFLGGHLLTHFCSTQKIPGVQIEVRRGLFSTSAHDISSAQLEETSSRVLKAILDFWAKFKH